MKNKEQEVNEMKIADTSALIEAIKIIAEKSETLEEVKNALDRIQDVLKNPK